MEIHRPYKNLNADRIVELGNDPANTAFEIEEGMANITYAAQLIVNTVNNLKDAAYDIADTSYHEDRNIVHFAEGILLLASGIKSATAHDANDCNLDEAKKNCRF